MLAPLCERILHSAVAHGVATRLCSHVANCTAHHNVGRTTRCLVASCENLSLKITSGPTEECTFCVGTYVDVVAPSSCGVSKMGLVKVISCADNYFLHVSQVVHIMCGHLFCLLNQWNPMLLQRRVFNCTLQCCISDLPSDATVETRRFQIRPHVLVNTKCCAPICRRHRPNSSSRICLLLWHLERIARDVFLD